MGTNKLSDYTELCKTTTSWNSKKSIWGVSPVAPIHLGFDSLILLQKEAVKLGVDKHFLIIADLHSMMTHDISWNDIKKRSYYYEFYFREICELENTEFILGSEFQTRTGYVELLYSSLREVPLAKTKNTIPSIKKNSTVFSYAAIYPIMQCIDIIYNNADFVIAESGQEKIYNLLEDILKVKFHGHINNYNERKTGIDFAYITPSHDIKGGPLNKSTSVNRISIHETESSLRYKVKKMYAPIGDENIVGKVNTLLETFKFSVFPWVKSVTIRTKEGSKEYLEYSEFELDYKSKLIHPNEAKNELFELLKDRIFTIQEKMSKGITNWINYEKLQ